MFKTANKTTKTTLKKASEIIDVAGDAIVEWGGVAVETGSLVKKTAKMANSHLDLYKAELELSHKFDLIKTQYGLKKKELKKILKDNGISLAEKDASKKVSTALSKGANDK